MNTSPQASADDSTFEPATCPQHGEFTQRVLDPGFGLPAFRSLCPGCKAERDAKIADGERREREAVALLEVRRLHDTSGIPPRFRDRTFASYQAENHGAARNLRIIERFAEKLPEQMETGATLLLSGGPGTGKTHLGCAVVRAAIEQHRKVARYATAADVMRTIKETYRPDSNRTEREVIAEFASIDLLVIDEVGVQTGSEHEKLLMFEVFNGRYANLKPTVVISNLTEAELETYLGQRLMDRFREGGAVLVFNWESRRGRS